MWIQTPIAQVRTHHANPLHHQESRILIQTKFLFELTMLFQPV